MSAESSPGDPPRRLYWGPRPAAPGWIRLAGEEGFASDLARDIFIEGLPLPGDSLECISCQAKPQELGAYDLLSALCELRRVLEPGGVLRFGFADLDKAVENYRAGRRERFWCQEWKSLGGNFVTQVLEYNQVRTPLTPEFAKEVLEAAGFVDVRSVERGRTSSACPAVASLDLEAEEFAFIEAFKPLVAPRRTEPGPAVEVHLSWRDDPSTSLTVVWRTAAGEGGGFVEYRRAGMEGWARAPAASRPAPGEGVLHEATLRNLAPGTDHEYRVSGDRGARPPASEVFRARTAPSPGPADFTFAFLCDTGIASRADGNVEGALRVLEEIVADGPLFVLGGGDYAYSDRDGRFRDVAEAAGAWFRQMEPLLARVPFFPQYGNHEVFLGERYRDWAPRFTLPEGCGRSYSFDVGDAHFTGLFVPGPPPGTDALDWLDRDLEAARACGARWLIVWQHEPIFAHGRSHPANPRVREALSPIFERHRVDLHLSGHDQSYERTYPLRIARDVFSWAGASIGAYERGSGVIYAKVSPGGKVSDIGNDFSRFRMPLQPWMAVRDDAAHHYALVTLLAKGELSFQAFAIPRGGGPKKVIDSFRVAGAPGDT